MAHQLLLLQVPDKPRYPYAAQMDALIKACGDGVPRSLAQIERTLSFKYSQTGISARLRDLRRGIEQFDAWTSQHTKADGRHFYSIRRRG